MRNLLLGNRGTSTPFNGEHETRHILRHSSSTEKAWVITRILEYTKWDDIRRYLTVEDIRQNLKRLQFRRTQDRELWVYALDRSVAREQCSESVEEWLIPLQASSVACFFATEAGQRYSDAPPCHGGASCLVIP